MEPGALQLQFPFRNPSAQAAPHPPYRIGVDDDLSWRAAEWCERLGLPGLARKVRVRWNPRMRSTAGRATWPQAAIELNPVLGRIGRSEVDRTFLHELAHLVAYERAGRRRIRPHGPEWRQACADLGIPGERASHNLPLPIRTMKRKWRYICPGCWVVVERVHRMKGRTACYACCRKFNGGYYDERFRFLERRLGA